MAERRGKVTILIEAKNLAGKVLLEVQTQAQNATKSLVSGFKKTLSGITRTTAGIISFGVAVTGVNAAIFARQLFKLGVIAEETGAQFRMVFGPAVEQVNATIEKYSRLMGLTTVEAQKLLATVGTMARGLGATSEETAKFSSEMLTLAADIAAFNGLPTAQVLRSIQTAVAGHTEALQKLGVAVTQQDAAERARLDTGKDHISQVTALERATAMLTLATERSGVAHGALARTANSTSATARRISADFGELRDRLAKAVLPIFAQLLGTLDKSTGALFAISTGVEKLMRSFAMSIVEVKLWAIDMAEQWVQVRTSISGATGFISILIGNWLGDMSQTLERFGINVLTGPAEALIAAGEERLAQAERSFNRQAAVFEEEREEVLAQMHRSLDPNEAAAEKAFARDEERRLAAEELRLRLLALSKMGRDAAQSLALVAVKADILGPVFNRDAERVKALTSILSKFTDEGLKASDVIPVLKMTVGEVASEIRSLSAGLALGGADVAGTLDVLKQQTEAFGGSFETTSARVAAQPARRSRTSR